MNTPPPIPQEPTPPQAPQKKDGFPKGCIIALIVAGVLALIAIPVIGFLASLALPAVNQGLGKAKEARVRSTMAQLSAAIANYQIEYRRFPVESSGEDVTLESRGRIMAALSGDPSEAGSEGMNPRQVTFYVPLSARSHSEDAHAQWDPWGYLYQIRIDSDFDNQVIDPSSGSPVTRSVIIWSAGPDGNEDTWEDNLKSWE